MTEQEGLLEDAMIYAPCKAATTYPPLFTITLFPFIFHPTVLVGQLEMNHLNYVETGLKSMAACVKEGVDSSTGLFGAYCLVLRRLY